MRGGQRKGEKELKEGKKIIFLVVLKWKSIWWVVLEHFLNLAVLKICCKYIDVGFFCVKYTLFGIITISQQYYNAPFSHLSCAYQRWMFVVSSQISWLCLFCFVAGCLCCILSENLLTNLLIQGIKWYLYCASLIIFDHSKHFTLQVYIHLFTDTFIHWWKKSQLGITFYAHSYTKGTVFLFSWHDDITGAAINNKLC